MTHFGRSARAHHLCRKCSGYLWCRPYLRGIDLVLWTRLRPITSLAPRHRDRSYLYEWPERYIA